MIQRFIIDGEPKYCELVARLVEDETNDTARVWNLVNHEIEIKFREYPFGQFDKFTDVPNNIDFDEDTKEELKTQIEGVIDNYIAQLRSGIEPEEDEGGSSEDIYPHDPEKITMNSVNWSVEYIFQLIEREIIDISPDFQRNFIWDYKRKCRLIESILLGIPIPAFYLAKSGKHYHVVDGLQRLTAIKEFINNKFPLKYLEYLNEKQSSKNNLEGCYFKNEGKKKGLQGDYEFRLKGTQFNINIIEEKTPTRVKFDVFRRINTGGKPLNEQEIRNSIMSTSARNLIKELAESKEFKVATRGSVTTKRMKAQEFVMRFIGFWFIRVLKIDISLTNNKMFVYQGNMRIFLDDLVEVLNTHTDKYGHHIKRDFLQAMRNAEYLFGNYCFRKCLIEHLESNARKQLINKSLFTTWSVMLSQIKTDDIYKQIENRGDFAFILADALIDDKKINLQDTQEPRTYFHVVSYTTNDKASLNIAFHKTKQLIDKYLSDEKSNQKVHHKQL